MDMKRELVLLKSNHIMDVFTLAMVVWVRSCVCYWTCSFPLLLLPFPAGDGWRLITRGKLPTGGSTLFCLGTVQSDNTEFYDGNGP